MAKKQNKEKVKYVKKVDVRMTESEYRILERRADENGSSMSQIVRWLLFKKRGAFVSSANVPVSEKEQNIINSICQSAKNINGIVSKVSPNFSELLLKNDKILAHILSDLSTNVNVMKNSLWDYFGEMGYADLIKKYESESIEIIGTDSKKPLPASTKKTSTKTFYYMQKIVICGRCVAAPTIFEAKNGSSMATFTVSCLDEKNAASTDYEVYINKELIASFLNEITENHQLIVTGNLRFRASVNKKGNPQNPLAVLADTVALGKDTLI